MPYKNPEDVKKYFKSENGKAAHKKAVKNYRKNNPEKYKATNMVNNHLRDKKISRPDDCSECNDECKPHAHHDDYSKPLVIRWLCNSCHKLWHRENDPK